MLFRMVLFHVVLFHLVLLQVILFHFTLFLPELKIADKDGEKCINCPRHFPHKRWLISLEWHFCAVGVAFNSRESPITFASTKQRLGVMTRSAACLQKHRLFNFLPLSRERLAGSTFSAKSIYFERIDISHMRRGIDWSGRQTCLECERAWLESLPSRTRRCSLQKSRKPPKQR